MKISCKIALVDFKAAQRLHIRQKLIRRIFVYVWPVLALVSLIGCVVFCITEHSELFAYCLILGIFPLSCTIGFPIGRMFTVRRLFKRSFHSSHGGPEQIIDIDNERIIVERPGISEVKFPWTACVDFAQDESVTMLYVSKNKFYIIPTPALSQDQRTELNDLIARHLPRENHDY
jgi:hypothetical protein